MASGVTVSSYGSSIGVTGGSATLNGNIFSGSSGSGGGGMNWNLTDTGIALSIAGGVASAVGGFYSSWKSAESYKKQAHSVLDNARLQVRFNEYNQKLTDEAYGVERLNLQKMQKARLASYRVSFAAEGLEMTGSAPVVMREQEKADLVDLQQIDKNAGIAALQSQMNSISIMSQANFEAKALKRMAKNAKNAAYVNLFGGILSTAGKGAYMWGTAR